MSPPDCVQLDGGLLVMDQSFNDDKSAYRDEVLITDSMVSGEQPCPQYQQDQGDRVD